MNALYQRLRDLEPKTFEDLCFQIISARHPNANATRVGDLGGDKGVDFFQGNLIDGPTIWQCKFFKNGIKSPQKTQIKHSLRTAIQNFQPKRWVLCVPIDLNVNAHTWFQRLRREYQGRADLGLFQASQIVRELLHRRNIRNMFFPGAVLEPDELRSILAGTGDYTNRELEKLTLENVQQYLQRLGNQDARFDYQVTFVPHPAQSASRSPLPGLIARVTDDDKQIDVFARDIEALRLDPPKVHFTVKGEGIRKLKAAITQGTKVELNSDDFSNIHSSFDFLLSGRPDPQHQRLTIQPSAIQPKQFGFKVVLGSGSLAVSYDLLRFTATTRINKAAKRVELVTADDQLPFRMSIEFPVPEMSDTPSEADISFRGRFVGKEVHEVRRFVRAMMTLKESGDVEVWDIRQGKLFFKSKMSFEDFPFANNSLLSLLNDVCEISDVFKAEIRFPESVTQEDNDSINLLLALAREGTAGAEVTGISCTLVKKAEHEHALLASLGREMVFQFQVDRMSPQPSVFGTKVDTGPCLIVAERAVLADEQRVRNEYISAKEGEGVVLRFNLLSPARVFRQNETAK
jgi:hypothetical protein